MKFKDWFGAPGDPVSSFARPDESLSPRAELLEAWESLLRQSMWQMLGASGSSTAELGAWNSLGMEELALSRSGKRCVRVGEAMSVSPENLRNAGMRAAAYFPSGSSGDQPSMLEWKVTWVLVTLLVAPLAGWAPKSLGHYMCTAC